MEPAPPKPYPMHMASLEFKQQPNPSLRPETAGERIARMAREEAIIAKAEADIDAGLGIEDDDVEAWLDLLDQDPEAPLPSPRSCPALR